MGVPGEDTVEANLVRIVHGALRFYRRAFPMMASMAAQPRLLMGACFQQGFPLYFAEGEDTPDLPESFARDLVRPVLAEVLP